jgi:hypothetical protein
VSVVVETYFRARVGFELLSFGVAKDLPGTPLLRIICFQYAFLLYLYYI